MPPPIDEATVLEKLREVDDPELHRDIVTLNMVRDLKIGDGSISMTLMLTTPACPMTGPFKEAVETALLALPGVATANVALDAEVRSHRGAEERKPVEGVKNIIAVASNKGGVGKSTIAVNISVALARLGASAGILDADITGPNIPTMLGIDQGLMAEGGVGLQTIEAHGIKAVSLGFVLPKGTPVVWRGPMIGSGVRQLLHDVDWGELDYLIVDLPPGTSDASMSMAQEAAIAGVVIVSTPQKVAIEDATKAVGMFDRLGVPIFGIVENMSSDVFGRGGAAKAADDLGIEFLGEVPLDIAIRESADVGAPIVATDPDSPQAQAFFRLAEQVAARCSVLQYAGEANVV